MTARHDTALAFDIKTIGFDRGRAKQVARIVCDQCGAHEDYTITGNYNPWSVRKQFEQKGWSITGRNVAHAKCPACVSKPKPKPEEVKMQTTAPNQPMINIPLGKGRSLELPAKPPASFADLTSDHKTRLRLILDGNFDDKAGRYLSNYSDEKVSAETNIPRAIVAQYRETAYGPIKSDPEIAALRESLVTIETKFQAVQSARQDLQRATDDLTNSMNSFRDRLKRCEQRVGIA